MRRPGGDEHVLSVERAVFHRGIEIGLPAERIKAVELLLRFGGPALRHCWYGTERIDRRSGFLAFERFRRGLARVDLVVDRLAVGRRCGRSAALVGQQRIGVGKVGIFGQFNLDDFAALEVVIIAHRQRTLDDRTEQPAQARFFAFRFGPIDQRRVQPEQIGNFQPHHFGFGQTAGAEFAAGHVANIGLHHLRAALPQGFDVALGRFVFPHPHIHRRHHQHRLVGGEQQRGGQIVGDPGGHFGHQIGGGGANDHQIGLSAQLDMPDLGLVLQIPQAGMHLISGKRRQRHRGDELRAAIGQHASYLAPTPADQAHQFARFVSSDTAAYYQQDAQVCHCDVVILR